MDKTNEVLKQYFTENEIKEIQSDKKDKYKELSEKISKLGNRTQIELANLKHELENLSLDEKINKVLNLVEESDKNQKSTKEQEKKAKKESEEKGFSWEKISKIVEEKGGWFSWAGISAGIGAIFSNIFSGLFDKVKDGTSELAEKAGDLASGETNGTWEGNIYYSEEKRLEVEKTNNGFLKNSIVKINGESYKIETNSRKQPKIIEESNESILVVGEDKIPLDRIGKIIDESDNKNEHIISKATFGKIGEAVDSDGIWDGLSKISDDFELKLVKESYYGTVKENFIKTGDTKIEFQEKIEGKELPINSIKIKEINILGKKYKIEPENQNFKLKKNGNTFLLSVEGIHFNTLKDLEVDDFDIDIRDIVNQINDKNKKENTEKYYLFRPGIDMSFENDTLQSVANFVAESTQLDIFLLKEIN